MKQLTRINKEFDQAKELLLDIESSITKGWKEYLGDPIYKYRREVIKEVERMKKEIRELSKVEPQEPKKKPKPLNSTPDWWIDLYTDGNGNCFSDADPGL